MNFFGKLKIFGVSVLLGCVLALGGCISSSAFAEEKPDYRIMASPATLNLELKPGETTVTSFKVINNGAKRFDFSISVAPYGVEGEEYNQNFTDTTKYNDLAKWVKLSEDSGSLDPDESKVIEVTVDVPKDVPDGGQYAILLAKMAEPSDPEAGASAVKAEKQLGVVIFSENVAGHTRKEGGIVEAKVPSFMFAPPIKATSVVENTGNVHAEATYIMQVYPLFGDEEVYTNEENPEKRTILPETRRLNTLTWDGAPQLGIFKVKQTVKFLDEVKEIEKVVFICPIWFLLIILVLIFLAVFWIVSRTRGRKE